MLYITHFNVARINYFFIDNATDVSHNIERDIHVAKEVAKMGTKGDQTKFLICSEAYKLFAEKGYKDVTMKSICERTGLSRGGLYRHYGSTEQIFLEIINFLMGNQQNEFEEKIQRGISATEILNDTLTKYEKEMIDSHSSLSIAIYEFFSNPKISKSDNSISQQYLASRKMWIELIQYGIQQKEFKDVNPEAVFDLIVFSYQGVRMYSMLMDIDINIPKGITEQIKYLLLSESEGA